MGKLTDVQNWIDSYKAKDDEGRGDMIFRDKADLRQIIEFLIEKDDTLREQIAREIEERIVERGETEPWDKDINVGLREAAAIARGGHDSQ